MTNYELACKVVDEAGQAGGLDEVRRIAERGWPTDYVWSKGAQVRLAVEELQAIQDRARAIVSEVDAKLPKCSTLAVVATEGEAAAMVARLAAGVPGDYSLEVSYLWETRRWEVVVLTREGGHGCVERLRALI